MMRKLGFAIAAAAAIGAATLTPTVASAHWRSYGNGGHDYGMYRGGGHSHGFQGPRFFRFHGFPGCWRWVPTPYGPTKVWVCR
jgi:hypothetical protein